MDLWVLRCLVWRRDTGEVCRTRYERKIQESEKCTKLTLNLSRPRLLVKTLGVALLDDAEGRVDEDLDERQPRLLVQLARDRAVRAVRRDERGQGDAARVREELRDL